jgi:aspartate racemase
MQIIGIVGGAGPLAGAFLLERLFRFATTLYGCYKDLDFPKVVLVSFPFSDMLSEKLNPIQIRKELQAVLSQLRNNGATVIAIACNTLHAFLDRNDCADVIELPEVIKQKLSVEIPLVLCTSTSAKYQIHSQFFPCIYPGAVIQKKIDEIIDNILKGCRQEMIIEEMRDLLCSQDANTVVLGCTELSIFKDDLLIKDKLIIDPLEILAIKVLENVFTKRSLCL